MHIVKYTLYVLCVDFQNSVHVLLKNGHTDINKTIRRKKKILIKQFVSRLRMQKHKMEKEEYCYRTSGNGEDNYII